MLTKDKIIEILHGNPDAEAWADAAMDILPKYEINTPNRIAGFFAQTGHESMNFTALSENLSYKAETLDKVFPKYFVKAGRNAADYAKQPEKIANVVYASRMGNGDTASGDGYRFRGRGVIQLTGRDNYTNFGKTIGLTADEVIDYVTTKKGALESACWYWNSRNINAACDANDITKMTKLINGGTIGLEDRKKHYVDALAILGGEQAPAPISGSPAAVGVTLRVGSSGSDVKKMQAALKIPSDGQFGPGTEKALKAWQSANGLTPDGVAGPKTLQKLLG
ncbi:COG3179 Predicted chitinase [uncultured Caudovirales phage]|uniref:COG3179 Predicted chitinase n=1 Tax=uncultured Caudovirales phage TaxID=2100421 RepID=A0A6J5N376_9CAUD|nr:COG3179 Predicted chitinase [uncultured Caudovirales phage]